MTPPATAEVKYLYFHSKIRFHGVVLNYLWAWVTFTLLAVLFRACGTTHRWFKITKKETGIKFYNRATYQLIYYG
jgi:hypothetical protein